MKVNEVMIGDWVEDLSPVKLVNIDADGWCAYNTDNGRIIADLENMEPIPLTDEILKKNGFVSSFNYYELEHENFIISVFHIPNIYYIEIERKDKTIAQIDVYYVHELQHVFKLCKIDKEIVL